MHFDVINFICMKVIFCIMRLLSLIYLFFCLPGTISSDSPSYASPQHTIYSNSITQNFGHCLKHKEDEHSKTMIVTSSPSISKYITKSLRGNNCTVLIYESVHVFASSLSATNWNEVFIFSAPKPNEQYGASVALTSQSTNIVVGAPCNEEFGYCAGAVYTYSQHEGNWSLQNTLKPMYIDQSQFFGETVVAFENQYNILLVGSPRLNEYPTDDYKNGTKNSLVPTTGGFVYIYFLNNSEWVLKEILSSTGIIKISDGSVAAVQYIDDVNNAKVNDRFGNSISAFKCNNKNTSNQVSIFLVGSEGDSSLGQNSGVVYVYSMTITAKATAWKFEAKIVNPDGYEMNENSGDYAYEESYADVPNIDIAEYSYFGHSVALGSHDDNAMYAYIGAHNASGIGGKRTGALHIYKRILQNDAIEWSYIQTLYPPDNEAVLEHSHFGNSFEVMGDVLVICAPYTKLNDGRVGVVYVYQHNITGNFGNNNSLWSLAATLQRPTHHNSTLSMDIDGFGSAVSLSVFQRNNSYIVDINIGSQNATSDKRKHMTGAVYSYSATKDTNGTLVFLSEVAPSTTTTTTTTQNFTFLWWLKGRPLSEIIFAGATLAALILLCLCYGVSIQCCVYKFRPCDHEQGENLMSLTPMKPLETETETENDKTKLLRSPYNNETKRRWNSKEHRAHQLMRGTLVTENSLRRYPDESDSVMHTASDSENYSDEDSPMRKLL